MTTKEELQLAQERYDDAGINLELASASYSMLERDRAGLVALLVRNGTPEAKALAAVQAMSDLRKQDVKDAGDYFNRRELELQQARERVERS